MAARIPALAILVDLDYTTAAHAKIYKAAIEALPLTF